MRPSLRSLVVGSFLSLVLHWMLVIVLPTWRARSARGPIEFELVPRGDADDVTASGAMIVIDGRTEVLPGGPDSPHNIDAVDPGQGGDARGAENVVRLLPRAEGISLADSPLNALGESQTQRIDTAPDRASLEDRRATPNPSDEPFLASGTGTVRQRRVVANRDPRPGARTRRRAQRRGNPGAFSDQPERSRAAVAGQRDTDSSGTSARTSDTDQTPSGADQTPSGADQTRPGPGILEGRGSRAHLSADVAHGRPPVDEAHAATTTEERDSRVRDDRSSEILTTNPTQSVVESTERAGTVPAPGSGGVDAPGAPGVGGGQREGGRAFALGPGRGSWDVLDTSHRRYQLWLMGLRRRIENRLEFPDARALAMDQGISVYRITVRRDGSLASRPQLIRSSGFDDFDAAAQHAIVRNAPFARIPDELVPARDSIEVTLPIEFSNPMVR